MTKQPHNPDDDYYICDTNNMPWNQPVKSDDDLHFDTDVDTHASSIPHELREVIEQIIDDVVMQGASHELDLRNKDYLRAHKKAIKDILELFATRTAQAREETHALYPDKEEYYSKKYLAQLKERVLQAIGEDEPGAKLGEFWIVGRNQLRETLRAAIEEVFKED